MYIHQSDDDLDYISWKQFLRQKLYTEGLLESILRRYTYKQVWKVVQAYLGYIVCSVTDHHNKQVIIFLLMELLAINL